MYVLSAVMEGRKNFFIKLLLNFFILMFLIISLLHYFLLSKINYNFSETAFQIFSNSLKNQTYFHHNNASHHDTHKLTRIVCWVCTHPETRRSVTLANELWGKHFDKTIYVTSNDSQLHPLSTLIFPVEKESRDKLWKKTMFAFRHLYTEYGESYDWFMKADDDSFVVTENLYRFLSNYNSSVPHYFGRIWKLNNQIYCSGGGGYVVSRAALKILIEGLDGDCKNQMNGIVEDYEFGRCLNRFGIYPEDSRDEKGRFRFNPFSFRYHYQTPKGLLPDWTYKMSKYTVMEGEDCCAEDVISFHYMNEEESIELNELLQEHPTNLLKGPKLNKFKF